MVEIFRALGWNVIGGGVGMAVVGLYFNELFFIRTSTTYFLVGGAGTIPSIDIKD